MTDPENIIVLRRVSHRQTDGDHRSCRKGRSQWEARDERKGYSAVGETRAEAVGKLLLDTCLADYLSLKIVG